MIGQRLEQLWLLHQDAIAIYTYPLVKDSHRKKIAQVHALFMIIVYREGLDRICRLGSIPAGFSAINDR